MVYPVVQVRACGKSAGGDGNRKGRVLVSCAEQYFSSRSAGGTNYGEGGLFTVSSWVGFALASKPPVDKEVDLQFHLQAFEFMMIVSSM